ncbi:MULTISPECIES: arginase [unclassified Haladaptatus]|uniref:arginase n=1 Tax=unclassified Haladaptatus TaxID=2622732 RepID=UPI0023E77492|nr:MULTISPECIES: arginase [unclassified Haladaptatus]
MQRTARLIGVPMDLGADRRGVDMGPSAIRYAGLVSRLADIDVTCTDAGDILVPHAHVSDPEAGEPQNRKAKYLNETATVCSRLAEEVAETLENDEFPLVLGGDHSIAIGTMSGAAREAEIGVIWFDAHGDFNTPSTSPSGNVHGMPLAAVLGNDEFEGADWAHTPAVSEENIVIVGLRSVDDMEREAIRDSEITAFTMSDIDERGVSSVVEEALEIASDGVDGVHVSLDMDWLDPKEAPGVGTPVRGGVNYREAHAALEMVAAHDRKTGFMRSLEIVEVNPILDEHNETAELATELAASALGKTTL